MRVFLLAWIVCATAVFLYGETAIALIVINIIPVVILWRGEKIWAFLVRRRRPILISVAVLVCACACVAGFSIISEINRSREREEMAALSRKNQAERDAIEAKNMKERLIAEQNIKRGSAPFDDLIPVKRAVPVTK